MNHFTLMLQKRLKNEKDDDDDEDDKPKSSVRKTKGLKNYLFFLYFNNSKK